MYHLCFHCTFATFRMAPEVIRAETPTTASDVNSFAIVMYEIFAKKQPYTGVICPISLPQGMSIAQCLNYKLMNVRRSCLKPPRIHIWNNCVAVSIVFWVPIQIVNAC